MIGATCSHSFNTNNQRISLMNKRSLLFIPTVLLLNPLFAADPVKNPDVLAQGAGSTWTTTTIGGGSTSYTPSAPLPQSTGIVPNYGTDSHVHTAVIQEGYTGLFGFFYNLGRTSKKDLESERVRAGIDKALSKSQAGIPLDSADYNALGSADLTKAPQASSTEKSGWAKRMEKHKGLVAQAHEKTAAASAAQAERRESLRLAREAKKTLDAIEVVSQLPSVSVPTPVVATNAPILADKFGMTCKPSIPLDGDLPSIVTKIPSLAEKMQAVRKVPDPTLLKDNPFKDLADMSSGGGVAGGVMKVVGGGAAAKTAVTTVIGATSGGTATATTVGVAGGGTVAVGGAGVGGAGTGTAVVGTTAGGTATTTTVGGAIITAAPYVALGAAVVGVAAGVCAVFDYAFPNENNIFFKQRYQAKLRNESAKNQSQVGGSSSPNPKKPDDEKEKRAKQIRDHQRWTNKEARERAKALGKGYEEKKNPPGDIKDIGFTNGKDWISPDMDGHNGGVWKQFTLKGRRIATLDKNLNRIKN